MSWREGEGRVRSCVVVALESECLLEVVDVAVVETNEVTDSTGDRVGGRFEVMGG